MKNIFFAITFMLVAAFSFSGCELADEGGLKLIPSGGADRVVGTDSTLMSLSVENFSISPSFDAETVEYTLVVSKATTPSLVVKAIGPEGATVTVAINGGSAVPVMEPGYSAVVALEETLDTNDIVASVTSEDALNTTEYHIRVYYLGTSASLSGLAVSLTNGSSGAVSSDLDPVFDPAHLTYAVGISYATASIDITVSMPEGSGMTATVDGWNALSGSPVPITNLPAAGGSRDITITVTSQDKGTTRDYTLTITKGAAPSTEARLDLLEFDYKYGVWYNDNTLLPEATPTNLLTKFNYSKSITWVISKVTLRFDVRPIDSSVKNITGRISIDGSATTPFTFSKSSDIYTGSVDSGGNGTVAEVFIDVTAEDETTVQTYTVTISI